MATQEPNLQCPFTGLPIEILRIADGSAYIGRVQTPEGGWHTSLFSEKEPLLHFLSTRHGVKPGFPKRTKIEVKESLPPSTDPHADLKEQRSELEDASNEVAEKVLHSRGKLARLV